MIQNTLYHNHKLIDLLNMNTGDHKIVTDVAMWNGESNDDENLAYYMVMMKGKKGSKPKYNYHGLLPNVVFGYIRHKTGEQFEKFLEDAAHIEVQILVFKPGTNPPRFPNHFISDRLTFSQSAPIVADPRFLQLAGRVPVLLFQ